MKKWIYFVIQFVISLVITSITWYLFSVISIVLNLILIPICSVYGAAIASLVTQFVANIVVCLILKPYRPSIQLMAEALNPKYCIDAAKKLLKREKKTDAKA